MVERQQVAVLGAGVIGGGWIARFLLHGFDVKVYDPNPDARRGIERMLSHATSAYRQLGFLESKRGNLSMVSSVAEAVENADYIQENVPENLQMKLQLYSELEVLVSEDAVIGSSTSGFTPSELRVNMRVPNRLVVAHPFNPVYLLPLVELVVGEDADTGFIARLQALYASIHMFPLVIKKELPGHIADRLLEAVWREALWLINDGVATTKEIDDAMTYGFGLRWAQMGLFETYRIAGGEAGMRHFIQQFGPALQWEWTKLMNVPDLTDELIDTISSQSDAQSGHLSIGELEKIRDTNIIGFLKVLKANRWGSGTMLPDMKPMPVELDLSAQPMKVLETEVSVDLIDYNQHMTESAYLKVFSEATDTFLGTVGLDEIYLSSGHSLYTLETHLRHLREVKQGKAIRVMTQLLGFDSKRIRIVHEMFSKDIQLATSEHMFLHVSTTTSKATPMPDAMHQKLTEIQSASQHLPLPDYAGQSIRSI